MTGVGHSDVFDIDIKTSGTNYYRRVDRVTTGTPVGDRNTIDLLLDSEVLIDVADITRVSFFRCARFDGDRVELLHRASGGVEVQVQCVEVSEP